MVKNLDGGFDFCWTRMVRDSLQNMILPYEIILWNLICLSIFIFPKPEFTMIFIH